MTPAQTIALWADTLRDISASGLKHCRNIHDRANYKTIQQISLEMFSLATGQPLDEIEALRTTIFNNPTPLSTGDAAIINNAGEILLIQRSDNQKWAMPGGALAVGETPAEGVVREALEETGVACKAVTLVGLYDSRLRGTTSPHHLYQVLFLCQPLDQEQQSPSHQLEVLAQGWFAEQELPKPLDPGHIRPIAHAFQLWRGEMGTYFDSHAGSKE